MNRRGSLPVGTSIAGYTIEGVLGRGGMAIVYRAAHRGHAQPVALKLIAPDARWGEETQARFEREAQLAGAVVHRNILPVYAAGEHEKQPFVVMKLEATDLGAVLRREGRLRVPRAVALVSQVAAGLDAANAHGLVHRDVKPSNVLLGEEEGEERAYVADFGVARASFSGEQLLSGEMTGTVGYASPEQIRGEPVDHRTDVYALGCLLYECLTGRVPFRRANSLATLWAHLHEEPPAPSVLVPELPRGLDAVVGRALAKDPLARYGSAGALADAALQAVDGRRARVSVEREIRALPSGTVTFLFPDVEGSTWLLHELGAEAYADELAAHRRLIREACASQGGVEVDTQGDAFFFAFPTATGALAAAQAMTEALASGPIQVRIGIHTGTPHLTSEGYVGQDVHRAARIASSGHGGQVVVSAATAELLEPSDTVPQGLSFVSLGSHRLKDFDGPVTLYQLGAGSFPPLKTIANTNLPTPASSFLGREAELYEADLLLHATRLLSVTGPGGAGKTRFALELARRAREERFSDYEDGVFSSFLSALRDPSLVLPTIAQTLSVREEPGTTALERLASHLASKKMLLLLDNLEHLLECAPALSELLQACPGLTLLVTSRERLRLQGERAYELPPLPEAEGVALFCERAQVAPSEPIRELCSRLEGLPLAIELAAARMSLLSPEQLLERLSRRLDLLKAGRGADPRQQTLRATMQWSHDLLAEEEQRLFRALSVFAGGCTLEAAEEVCGADLDTLESLLDKSLLRRVDAEAGPRFWMLETIREFAAERLAETDAVEDALDRHLAWVVDHVRAYAPQFFRVADPANVERLFLEEANIRAALAYSIEGHRVEQALELVGLLVRAWVETARMVEGRAWAERALALEGVSPVLRAHALLGMGFGAFDPDPRETAHWLTARDLFLRAGAERDAAVVQALRAGAAGRRGDYDVAIELLEQALATFEKLGDGEGLRSVRGSLAGALGESASTIDELDRAIALAREALVADERAGDPYDETAGQMTLCWLLLRRGDHVDARRHLACAASSLRTANALRLLPDLVVLAAHHAHLAGAPERALELATAAEAVGRELGHPDPSGQLIAELDTAAIETELDTETAARATAHGEALTIESVFAYLEKLE
ncbi:MAG TPA: protein kinase [Longimicrobiales bacterium]|nr:protein kinase [Longimicrobiales bacterium]